MNTYSSNQVKARDQWTVKRETNGGIASVKVFFINVLVFAGAVAVAIAIVK